MLSTTEMRAPVSAHTLERAATPRAGPRASPGRAPLLSGAEPYSFPGNGPAGCLLVHGFTSTPYDTRACGAYLSLKGIAAEGVLLAGHGTAPEDLARTGLHDWLDSIRDAHATLARRAPRVFGLGISLAGNFLISLSQELDFAGLILVGTPLHFRRRRSYRALYYAFRALGVRYQRKWYQQSLDPRIRRARPNYRHIPLACARDALRAVEWSRAALPAVRCPVLAIQSTTDHALDARTMEEFSARLGTTDVTTRWARDRYHVVLIDHGKEEIFKDIHAFIAARAFVP